MISYLHQFTWISIEGFKLNRQLVENEPTTTNKTSDINESSIKYSYEQLRVIGSIPPPPPPIPPPLLEGDTDVRYMAHVSTHIPLYKGNEDPRKHWLIYELTCETNVVTNEDR